MSRKTLWQFEWRDDFILGDPLIDAQHQAFFTEAEQIRAALTSDEPKVRIVEYCTAFLSNLRQHFHDEEALMSRIGFPDLRPHQLEHSRLLAQGDETFQEIVQATCLIDCVLGTRSLLELLAGHIAHDDVKIRDHMGAA